MKNIFSETFTLSNGVKIPKLALGTWPMEDAEAEEAVRQAVKIGYRHIDTAQAYGNEAGVGRGVLGSGVPREDLFVTSKVAAENKTYDSAAKSIDESLERSGLDYFDLMIIHSPQPWVEVNQSDDRHFEGNVEAFRAMEDAMKAGKLRAIGVSNFLKEDIDNLIRNCSTKPMINQILAHISNTPLDLIRYCQDNGIVVEAYSPVAHGVVLNNPDIAKIAQKYGVSVAQLCLRYCLQLDMVILPKTANPEHMKENAALDFTISDEDMETLKNFEPIKDYGDSSGFPVYGGKI
ncbi:MAG: aldo/keto reductase [Anaerovoracaceae bacterium]|jgi:diketogulonate reductase-like aldo/keto reductase